MGERMTNHDNSWPSGQKSTDEIYTRYMQKRNHHMEQNDIYKQSMTSVITALGEVSLSWSQQLYLDMKGVTSPLHKQIQAIFESLKPDYGNIFAGVVEYSQSSMTAIFAEQHTILKNTMFSDELAKILDHHRINSVKRFVQSSELSPLFQDAFMHRYHVLSEAYRVADKADKQSDNRKIARKRRLQKHRKQHVSSIAYWDTSDSMILRQRLDCVYLLAITGLDVATPFLAAYDAFARKNIDYRRHTLVSARTVVEQLVRASGKGIDTTELEKKLVESGISKRKYTHKKTQKIIREKAIPLYYCYSKPQFGQTTADELEEFSRQLNYLHDAQINLNDDQLAALIQRLEIFICDIFAFWYTLGHIKRSRNTTATS